MALRRRRRFRSGSRGRQGPSRFAGSKRGARTLEWISLGGQTEWENLNTALATVEVVGTSENIFVTLLPANIAAGGEVTLQRIVGTIGIAYRVTQTANFIPVPFTAALDRMLGLSIQLIQTRHGATGPESLDTFNASDLDSSNFLWRQSYPVGYSQNAITGPSLGPSADTSFLVSAVNPAIDIRVKRRFDRSQWALTLNATVDVLRDEDWAICFELRGLFLTSGGI